MIRNATLWQISLRVPLHLGAAFETALEPFCDAVASMETADGGSTDISGYVSGTPDEVRIRQVVLDTALAHAISLPEVTVVPVEDRDWVTESLKSFAPFRVGRFYIHGAHVTDPPPRGTLILSIDASVAFGTGEHASTAGCLAAFEFLSQRAPPRRVLDMGCGSGILALAAGRLWRGARILGVDLDPAAVGVARGHAEINRLDRRARFLPSAGYAGGAVRRAGPYDLIVANILARPLMAMAKDAAAHLAPGGMVVLSGFITRDENRVMMAHRRVGLLLVRSLRLGGWTTLILMRPTRSRPPEPEHRSRSRQAGCVD